MKRINLFTLFALYLASSLCVIAQDNDKKIDNNSIDGKSIEAAPADKAVVYFVRPSVINWMSTFTYFDSTTVIGTFNGPKYIRYECEPGSHLFWVRSENRDFVEAEVEAGKIYFIEAAIRVGVVKSGVELIPIDPTDSEKLNKLLNFIDGRNSESFTAKQLENKTKKVQEAISNGLEKYQEEKAEGIIFAKLEKSMYYNQ